MRLRDLRIATTLALLLVGLALNDGYAQDGNAVGGSAESAEDGNALGGVEVTLTADPSINDTTRDEDGVYTIKVPASLEKFSLVFSKIGYLDTQDPDVPNGEQQQKRPIARMTPESSLNLLVREDVSAVGEIASTSIKAVRVGVEMEDWVLFRSARTNLVLLQRSISDFVGGIDEPVSGELETTLVRVQGVLEDTRPFVESTN